MTVPWMLFMIAFEAACLAVAAVAVRLALVARNRFNQMLLSAHDEDVMRWARGPDGTVWVDLGRLLAIEESTDEQFVPVRRLRWLYGRALAPQGEVTLRELLR